MNLRNIIFFYEEVSIIVFIIHHRIHPLTVVIDHLSALYSCILLNSSLFTSLSLSLSLCLILTVFYSLQLSHCLFLTVYFIEDP